MLTRFSIQWCWLLFSAGGLAAIGSTAAACPVSNETIGGVRQMYDGALEPDLAVRTFRNIDRLFPTRSINAGSVASPLPPYAKAVPNNLKFMSRGKTWDLMDYLAVNRVSGLLVLKDGKIARETYQYGNNERSCWMSMSVAKSITSTLIGAAIKDGYIKSIDDPVTQYAVSLKGSVYDGVSIKDVLMMSSGVAWDETYTDPRSDRRQLLEAQIAQRPGALLAVMKKLSRAAPPGTVNNYSTGETQIAGEVLYAAIKRPLSDYLSERIWKPFGMEADATWWLSAPNSIEVAGSGISATLRDYGRFGLFVLNGGRIGEREVLPASWVQEAGSRKQLKNGKPLDYGYFWWPVDATDATPDPQDSFRAIGIFGQFIYMNPSEHLVIVVWSARSKPRDMDIIDDVDFFGAVAKALH